MFLDPPIPDGWAEMASERERTAEEVLESVQNACAAAIEAEVAVAESTAALRAVESWADRVRASWSEEAWSIMCHQQNALASATEADLFTADESPTKGAAIEAQTAAELADLHARSTLAETRLSWNGDFIDPLVSVDNAAAEALEEALELASSAAASANKVVGADSNFSTAAIERVIAALETVNARWAAVRSVSNALFEAQSACTDPTGDVEAQISIARASVWRQRAEARKGRAPKRGRFWK